MTGCSQFQILTHSHIVICEQLGQPAPEELELHAQVMKVWPAVAWDCGTNTDNWQMRTLTTVPESPVKKQEGSEAFAGH